MRKNVLVVSGTRADFGLWESTIDALGRSGKLSAFLLLTGMHTLRNYGYTTDEVKSKGYKISEVVSVLPSGDMLLWLGEEITGINHFCHKNNVDCILVLGDRDEMLAGAIVGTHLGIPVGHVHGGEISGETVVDSKNRNAITQLATFHFAATKKSAGRISKMRLNDENVFVVGAPGVDMIKKIKIKRRDAIAQKFNLDPRKKWIMVVIHPTPLLKKLTFLEQIGPVCDALVGCDFEIIWVYPNSDTGSNIFIEEIESFAKRKSINLFENLPREDFVEFLSVVNALVGNSSSGIIESTYFCLPVINIGNRQKGRERSTNIIDCDYNRDEIRTAIEKALSEGFRKVCRDARPIYGDGSSGMKIVKILEEKL